MRETGPPGKRQSVRAFHAPVVPFNAHRLPRRQGTQSNDSVVGGVECPFEICQFLNHRFAVGALQFLQALRVLRFQGGQHFAIVADLVAGEGGRRLGSRQRALGGGRRQRPRRRSFQPAGPAVARLGPGGLWTSSASFRECREAICQWQRLGLNRWRRPSRVWTPCQEGASLQRRRKPQATTAILVAGVVS
jgi:hypothetical protein